ncbi:MAG: NAD-dependent epimerase/dehydratase family protein [Nitrospiraceae bacterium]|nr:NAD-dependent epimerase/dehydratase family protein [Nitrospiraceae bacterium]
MKVLLTGATGFIGSHLAEALVERGYQVTCLTRKTSSLRWIGHLDLEYIHADLGDPHSYAEKLHEFGIIFHLAGLTKAAREEDFFSVNYGGTVSLLQAVEAGNPGMRRFVHVSSLAAAGPSLDGRPVDESTPPRPVSAYGRSKLKAEDAVRAAGGKIPFTIVRPPAVYGPRDTDFLMMFKTIRRGFFPFWGISTYSLLHVTDVVRGIIMAAEAETAAGKTFFLSDHMVYTNEDIAREIGAALGSKPLRLPIPRAIFPIVGYIGQKIDKKGIINRDRILDFSYTNWTCDPSRAERELGYTAIKMLREGIKWTAEWYRTHQWL